MERHTWLHIGLGSFHRAHQAWYFNELLKKGESAWQFWAGNIRADVESTVQGMLKQNCQYTLETVNPKGQVQFTTISSISKVLPYEQGLSPLINAGAEITTKVISFTVTEAGYYLRSDLSLDLDNQYVHSDLNGGVETIYGVITQVLVKRMSLAKNEGLTLLCCDNVRENGDKFRHGLLDFLQHCSFLQNQNKAVIEWFENMVTTPNTMVDRITPRVDPTLSSQIKQQANIDDLVPVMSESFIQWVIEDRFKNGRPALEKVGVQMVESVVPYEDAKLRILNASHSCLAWSGAIKRLHYVYECAQDPQLHKFAYDYVSDGVIPCLQQAHSPIDLVSYRDTTLERFCNNHLKDQLERIAQDSFSKFYTFVKPTLLDCYKYKVEPSSTVFLAALYYVFLEQVLVEKKDFAYQDSSFDLAWYQQVMSNQDPILAYAQTPILFDSLATDPSFVVLLRQQIERAYQLKAGVR